jgi:hypothetical protein
MAADKKVQQGVVITTFSTVEYHPYQHRNRSNYYTIRHNALYMYNRRERTTGATVPIGLKPILEKFGIKCIVHRNSDTLIAVGCRTHSYYQEAGETPYPNPSHIRSAKRALEQFKATCLTEGQSPTAEQASRTQQFIIIPHTERKLQNIQNKEVLAMLFKPIQEYVYNERYM